jgi:hypothetical protein
MNKQANSKSTKHVSSKLNALSAALLAGVIAVGLQQSASAASIVDFPAELQYAAKIGEVNNVSIKPLVIAGSPVLEIRDFAGLRGCTPNSGSVITVRCNANQLVFFPMEMDNENDILRVDESTAVLTGYVLSVNGGLGDEDLSGGSEEDEFRGGSGDDLLDGNGGNDSLYGELGNDRLLGGPGIDHLDGGSGRDILFGEAGNDTLDGGTFDDVLNGGFGQDIIRGGSGDDTINAVDGEHDTIDCGLGQDNVRADPFDSIDRNCDNVTLVNFVP